MTCVKSHYNADHTTLISQEVPTEMALPSIDAARGSNYVSTINYDNGKPTTLVTDISDIENKTDNGWSTHGKADPITQLLDSVELESNLDKRRTENLEKDYDITKSGNVVFKDKKGNVILSFKDGVYYDKKGKEIDRGGENSGAWKILYKAHNKGDLAIVEQELITQE